MWILPKNIFNTCPSAPGLKEWGLDCGEFSTMSEKSLTLRGTFSAKASWSKRWKRESYIQHLSSRALNDSLSISFVEKYRFSQPESHVNPIAVMAKEKGTETNATCQNTSWTASGLASQQASFWKMLAESSQPNTPAEKVFCTMSSANWNNWVTEQQEDCSRRLRLKAPTSDNESSYWPPPDTAQAQKVSNRPNHGQIGLANHPKVHMSSVQREKLQKDRKGDTRAGHPGQTKTSTNGSHYGLLNADWIESLMGMPTGWTASTLSETQ